jgi:hypothetical protein
LTAMAATLSRRAGTLRHDRALTSSLVAIVLLVLVAIAARAKEVHGEGVCARRRLPRWLAGTLTG